MVQMATPTTMSVNLQQRLARVSEQFGSTTGGVIVKEEDEDDEDEDEEELAVNHSGNLEGFDVIASCIFL